MSGTHRERRRARRGVYLTDFDSCGQCLAISRSCRGHSVLKTEVQRC